MQNYFWKHRIVLVLLVILLVQVPFVLAKLMTSDQKPVYAIIEAAQILLSSGLAGYLFSKTFESLLERRLYGGFRRDWKDVRVMYSDEAFQGMGDAYPREPTLLIRPPVFGSSRTDSSSHGPMSVSFNTAYVGQPAAGEGTWVTGKWSELQLMRVDLAGHTVTSVGFPDTLVTLGKTRTGSRK